MKKSNVTVIAAILAILHIAIFLCIFIGSDPGENTTKPSSTREEPSLSETLPPQGIPVPPAPEPASLPPVTTASPPQPLESIAVPDTKEGYLRSDRPNHRTTKVFSRLIGNPYQGAIVVDARTGKILFEHRANAYAYPASVTKLMTLLLVLEQVEKGLVGLYDKVEITREGMGIGGSQAYFDVRESSVFTVDDLLNALAIHSANDAARILGIHVAGSTKVFVEMMNKKARDLGMSSTIYHSEHGLPPSGGLQPDISTPYDVALLSMAVLRHPEALRYTGTKLTYLPLSPLRKERFMLANRNALVEGPDGYSGCDGLKTGYHRIGGWSLAATAERDGKRVVAVVLGCPDKTTRNAETRKLLDRGFQAVAK